MSRKASKGPVLSLPAAFLLLEFSAVIVSPTCSSPRELCGQPLATPCSAQNPATCPGALLGVPRLPLPAKALTGFCDFLVFSPL